MVSTVLHSLLCTVYCVVLYPALTVWNSSIRLASSLSSCFGSFLGRRRSGRSYSWGRLSRIAKSRHLLRLLWSRSRATWPGRGHGTGGLWAWQASSWMDTSKWRQRCPRIRASTPTRCSICWTWGCKLAILWRLTGVPRRTACSKTWSVDLLCLRHWPRCSSGADSTLWLLRRPCEKWT